MTHTRDTTASELFAGLAEQVRLPFLQIAHAAELLDPADDRAQAQQAQQDIQVTARAALQLIDGYLLSTELGVQQELELEPVSLSAVLYDAAQSLWEYARVHDCRLELEISGRYGPVMAHRRAVETALGSLGQGFIDAAVQADVKKPLVKLALRRTGKGISAGAYGAINGLDASSLRQARALKGRSRQPFAAFDGGAGAAVLIADALFACMQAPMYASRLHGLSGLAATLTPSRQLSIV